ncbi:MAG TPA: hypothetical protein VKD28_15295 [Gemmatimonadales bacterium]|nr:hypothetical protein [Gemmatimonadales bacterium]
MAALRREDVIEKLGRVDDSVIDEIVAMGATAAELDEALAWVENDEAMLNDGRPLPRGRVARLIEIIRDVEEGDEREQVLQ